MARPGISKKNSEKIPPGPKFWKPKKTPPKYRKNTKNGQLFIFKNYFGGILSVFWGYLGEFWESRTLGRGGGISPVFFVEIPGRAISDLCSKPGGSQRKRDVYEPTSQFHALSSSVSDKHCPFWYPCP